LKVAIAFRLHRFLPIALHTRDDVVAVEQLDVGRAAQTVVAGERAQLTVTGLHAVVVDRIGRARVLRLAHRTTAMVAAQRRLGRPDHFA
jgi:hypothetical protein